MYTEKQKHEAITAAVFTLTSCMTEGLRKSVLNGDIGDALDADAMAWVKDAFNTVALDAVSKAYGSFMDKLNEPEVSYTRYQGISSIASATSNALDFLKRPTPSQAVLNEKEIANTILNPSDDEFS